MIRLIRHLFNWVRRVRAAVLPNPEVFEVSWAPTPSGTGWYVRWNPNDGESLVYYSPEMDIVFVSVKPSPGTLFLGPFQLPNLL